MAIKHKIRDAKGKEVSVSLTPIRAIRKFCIECMGHQIIEVPKCTAPFCPLFPFRMGDSHSIGSEQREKMRESPWGVAKRA
jgi:hypothetical protein